MKCKYCGYIIESLHEGGQFETLSLSRGITCPECDSYYYLLEVHQNYWTFNVYPSKYYKQFYENETLRVLKARISKKK